MKKIIIALLITLMPALGFAAGGGVHLDKADVDLTNQASLQNGAKLFVNYCLSCHSAAYMRYNRMAKDLGRRTGTKQSHVCRRQGRRNHDGRHAGK